MTDSQAEVLGRLQAVEGEVAEMARLIEQEDCLAAVRRGLAARRALGAIGLTLLEVHLRDEVTLALACADPDCRTRRVTRLTEVYETLTRLLCPACRDEWPESRLPVSGESEEEAHVRSHSVPGTGWPA